MKGARSVAMAMAAAGVALLVASTATGETTSTGGPAANEARKGGTFRIVSAADFDHVDPGLAYASHSWEMLGTTQLRLFYYPYVEPPRSERIEPMAARAMPRVSKDGRTYTVEIKRGFRFSNGQAVTAASFAKAFERANLRPSRRAGGSPPRTASCRRRDRARAPPARPGSTRPARAARPVEVVELPAEEPHAGADVAVVRPRRCLAEQHLVDELPGLREQLHDSERTCARDDVLLEARLHPGDGARELRVDAVGRRPAVERGDDRVAADVRARGAEVCPARQRQALPGHDRRHE